MTGMHIAMLVAGFFAGLLNAAAVGGATISFVVLLVLGFPVPVANASNLAAMPMSFLGGFRRAWIKRAEYLRHWRIVLVAVLGCLAGVAVVTFTGDAWLRPAAPGLLVLAAALIVFGARKPKGAKKRPATAVAQTAPLVDVRQQAAMVGRADAVQGGLRSAGLPAKRLAVLLVLIALTGVYAGAFGAGVGALVMAVLMTVGQWSVKDSQDGKIVICLMTSLVGSVAFGFTGPVAWEPTVIVGIGMAVGGLVGDQLVDRLPAGWLRIGVVIASVGAAGWLVST